MSLVRPFKLSKMPLIVRIELPMSSLVSFCPSSMTKQGGLRSPDVCPDCVITAPTTVMQTSAIENLRLR